MCCLADAVIAIYRDDRQPGTIYSFVRIFHTLAAADILCRHPANRRICIRDVYLQSTAGRQ